METVITSSRKLRQFIVPVLIIPSGIYAVLLATMAGVIVMISTSTAHASSWDFGKGVSLSIGFVRSDAGTGDAAELADDGFSTNRTIKLSPYVTASRQTRLLSLTGRAGVVYRDSESESNATVDPDASLLAIATIVDSTLWLDSRARASRQLVNGSVIDDATTLPDEAVNAYEFAIGPRWQQNLSQSISASAKYEFSVVDGSGSSNLGSHSHSVGAQISKRLSDGKTQLAIRVEGQRDNFDTDDTSTSELVIGTASFAFKHNLIGRVLAGRDRLENESTEFDESSTVYGAGIEWQPTRHLFVDAEYSERTFGSKPAVSVVWQGRVSSIGLSWSRTARISQGLEFGNVNNTDPIPDGSSPQSDGGIADLGADGSGTGGFAAFSAESDDVVEEIALTYRLQGRVNSFKAQLSRTEQEQLSSSGGETANKIELDVIHDLTRFIQLGFRISATDGDVVSEEGVTNGVSRQQALLTFSLAL